MIYRLLAPFTLLLLAACSDEVPVLTGATMGTTYSVIVPDLKHADKANLKSRIDSLLTDVNAAMSTWDKDSAISRFNESESIDWVLVPEDFVLVTNAALTIAESTDGAFDPTVGPLIKLWGFGARNRNEGDDQSNDSGSDDVPTSDEVLNLLEQTGFEKLQVDTKTSSLKKSTSALRVDLNAIAKGYAVDLLAEAVTSAGYTDYLVEIGGELRISGENADGEPWRVGIERPLGSKDRESEKGQAQEGLYLNDGGVATSGDYRNAFESDGVRYSHIIDARNGVPVSHDLASVTVVADSAMMADGWATALMVLGPDDGMKIADELGLAAFFILRDSQQGFITRSSAEFVGLQNR